LDPAGNEEASVARQTNSRVLLSEVTIKARKIADTLMKVGSLRNARKLGDVSSNGFLAAFSFS
jgi:hypothetical protein